MTSSEPWIVLIAGGHSAGKKVVARDLEQCMAAKGLNSKIIHIKDYLRGAAFAGPDSYDFVKFKQDLEALSQIVLVEGYYALFDPQVRDKALIRVFLDSDADWRLSQWILRESDDDPSKLDKVLQLYLECARSEMTQHIQPTKQYADVILPRGSEPTAISLLAHTIAERVTGDQIRPVNNKTNGLSLRSLSQEALQQREEQFYEIQ